MFVVKATMEIRAKAVILNEEGIYSADEISRMYNISGKTLRRWKSRHKSGGIEGLKPLKPGPKEAKHKVNTKTEQCLISLKQKYPHWGAKRIKHQFNLQFTGRQLTMLSKGMSCLSESRQSHSLASDLQGIMLTPCGKETPSSSGFTTWRKFM